MAGFQLEGRIHLVYDVQSFDSGFTKREFVVETMDGQYPQRIKFELIRERTALVDGLNPGDPVMVHFDIRGNEYQGRYFVNLNCWRLDRVGAGAQPGYGAPQQQPYGAPPQQQPYGAPPQQQPYGARQQQPYGAQGHNPPPQQPQPRQQQPAPAQPRQSSPQPHPAETAGGFEDGDEDIPF